MGEVGGYQLHLYCDHPKHNVLENGEGFGEFHGARSLTQARQHARECGWIKRFTWAIHEQGSLPAWICPSCAARPKSEAQAQEATNAEKL